MGFLIQIEIDESDDSLGLSLITEKSGSKYVDAVGMLMKAGLIEIVPDLMKACIQQTGVSVKAMYQAEVTSNEIKH